MTEEETSINKDCWHGGARPLIEKGRLLKLAVFFPMSLVLAVASQIAPPASLH